MTFRRVTRARALWYVGERAEALALADRTRDAVLAVEAPALAAEAGVLAVQIALLEPDERALDDLSRRLQAARGLAESSANHGVLARIDVAAALADHAMSHNWCRPDLADTPCLDVTGGR